MIYSDNPASDNENIQSILKKARTLKREYVRVTYFMFNRVTYGTCVAHSEGILKSIRKDRLVLYRTEKQNRGIPLEKVISIEEAKP